MAQRLHLRRPYHGLRFIWDVSEHVGDTTSCPNRATDVSLVKILIGETIRGPGELGEPHPSPTV